MIPAHDANPQTSPAVIAPLLSTRAGRWRRLRKPLLLSVVLISIGLTAWLVITRRDHRAKREWNAAQVALGRRDLSEAAVHLEQYTAFKPEDSAGWFLLARTERRMGRFAEAKRHLAEFEKLGGSAESLRLERDLILVQQGLIGEADNRLRDTINPDHPDVRFVLEALARGYIIAERWADARQACELWRAIEPDAPLAWLWGGWVAERMVQAEQAAEFYQRALELAPNERDTRIAFARIQTRQRNPAVATPHYEWALARNGDDVEALLGIAQCRIEEGRSAEAGPWLDRALKLDPNSNLAIALRGRALLESGDAAEAERWLRRAVQADTGDAEALHHLVLSLRAQRKDTEAAGLAVRLEQLQKDLRRLTELVRLVTPKLRDPGPCHEAGAIALRIGRTQQGLNLLEDALRRDPAHRPTHRELADHYRKSGRLDLAEVHQNLADKH